MYRKQSYLCNPMEKEQHLIILMQQHGIRPTANRIIVAKTLAEACRPLTMGELDDHLGSIDKSSIFRTLTVFKEQHLVHVLEDSEGTRYELCHSHDHSHDDDLHVHFYCTGCHKTFCLESVPVPEVAVPEGFTPHSATHLVRGLCPDCKG